MFLETLIAKFGPALLDVILAIPDPSGSTFALSCEINGHKAIRQPGMTLVKFAQQHYGHGQLRKIGTHHYAVLKGAPVQPVPVQTIPLWAYHVV